MILINTPPYCFIRRRRLWGKMTNKQQTEVFRSWVLSNPRMHPDYFYCPTPREVAEVQVRRPDLGVRAEDFLADEDDLKEYQRIRNLLEHREDQFKRSMGIAADPAPVAKPDPQSSINVKDVIEGIHIAAEFSAVLVATVITVGMVLAGKGRVSVRYRVNNKTSITWKF